MQRWRLCEFGGEEACRPAVGGRRVENRACCSSCSNLGTGERGSLRQAGLFSLSIAVSGERITVQTTNSEGSNWSVNWSLEGVLWRVSRIFLR